MKLNKIIIAGGGTGGHIFPAIAVANALRRIDPSIEVLFIGAKGKMEMEKVPQAGYRIEGLDIAGFNRASLLKNWSLPFKLPLLDMLTIFSIQKSNVGHYAIATFLRILQVKQESNRANIGLR